MADLKDRTEAFASALVEQMSAHFRFLETISWNPLDQEQFKLWVIGQFPPETLKIFEDIEQEFGEEAVLDLILTCARRAKVYNPS